MGESEKMRNLENGFIYCHFAGRAPEDGDKGLFAVALYKDAAGKQLIAKEVRRTALWEKKKHVVLIQSYHMALECLYRVQGFIQAAGYRGVILVTGNSTLNGWISESSHNARYRALMNEVNAAHRRGAPHAVTIGVGLSDESISNRAKKYTSNLYLQNEDIIDEDDRKEEWQVNLDNLSSDEVKFIDVNAEMEKGSSEDSTDNNQ